MTRSPDFASLRQTGGGGSAIYHRNKKRIHGRFAKVVFMVTSATGGVQCVHSNDAEFTAIKPRRRIGERFPTPTERQAIDHIGTVYARRASDKWEALSFAERAAMWWTDYEQSGYSEEGAGAVYHRAIDVAMMYDPETTFDAAEAAATVALSHWAPNVDELRLRIGQREYRKQEFRFESVTPQEMAERIEREVTKALAAYESNRRGYDERADEQRTIIAALRTVTASATWRAMRPGAHDLSWFVVALTWKIFRGVTPDSVKTDPLYHTEARKASRLLAEEQRRAKEAEAPFQASEPSPYVKVYYPSLDNEPTYFPPVITAPNIRGGQSQICSIGDITTIVAGAGSGKSSLVQAIWAGAYKHLSANPDTVDTLGLSVNVPDGLLCKYLDGERTKRDHWEGYRDTLRRANIHKEDAPRDCFALIRELPFEERIPYVLEDIRSGKYGLYIVDGIGDLVSDTNDKDESENLVTNILGTAISENDVALIVTIHNNPTGATGRGHTGGDLWRRSAANLRIMVEGETRILTSNPERFPQGKTRKGSPVDVAFVWSDELHMHVSATTPQAKEGRKRRDVVGSGRELAIQIIKVGESLKHGELIKRIATLEKCSEPTAKRRVSEMLLHDIISKDETTKEYYVC